MPRICHAVFLSAFVFASEARPQGATAPSVIPADQSADIYGIYSAVIGQIKLSHTNTATKYLIENATGFSPDPSPVGCVTPPAAHRRSFDEILAAFAAHKSDSFRLERKFAISKPYEILDAAEVKQFIQMTMNPSPLDGSRDGVDKFRGATDVIRLGNVYFNHEKRSPWCAPAPGAADCVACGYGGYWSGRKTVGTNWNGIPCITVASQRTTFDGNDAIVNVEAPIL